MYAQDDPMLDTDPQKNHGIAWEDSGKTAENINASAPYERAMLLARASAIAAEAANDARENGWKADWLLLLQALARLTEQVASEGDPAPLFTAERIRKEIGRIVGAPEGQWWSEESESTRKKFSNAWKSLESDIACLSENLRGRARKKNVCGIVAPAPPTKLGTTNAMGYGLTVMELDLSTSDLTPNDSLTLTAPDLTAPVPIEYLEEMEVYPMPGLNRPFRISVPGWRALLIVLPLVFALFIGVGLIWLLLQVLLSEAQPRQIFQWTLLTLIAGGVLASLVYPIYRLIHDKIIRAPSILELTLPLGHVLVLRHEGEDRVLRMLRFTSKCPICGGNVSIESGRRNNKGRLVGECTRNPIEHTFSFDFITRRGDRL